jgi:hypothetical protein
MVHSAREPNEGSMLGMRGRGTRRVECRLRAAGRARDEKHEGQQQGGIAGAMCHGPSGESGGGATVTSNSSNAVNRVRPR